MALLKERLRSLALDIPEIYLPSYSADFTKWAVVACDQYSSEPEYWEEVGAFVGNAPSTYNLIFPECYLEGSDKAERVKKIQAAMNEYLQAGKLEKQKPGFILVERSSPYEKHPRKGLVIAVDLECYQYGQGVTSLIRPTEGTIIERLPPRMEIRRGAPLELPHIMLLIDDPNRTVIEPLYEKIDDMSKLYDFDLMQKSGHIKGALISDENLIETIADALEKLVSAYKSKYGSSDVLLYAVGDGNHSLATAKAIWEETKKAGSTMDHPARYALVELINIYDIGLPFHPIHRVLYRLDETAFLDDMKKSLNCELKPMGWEEAVKETDITREGEHCFAYVSARKSGFIQVKKPLANLAAGTIQSFIDQYLKQHTDTGIDYIHGTESFHTLATKPGNAGLYLPPIDKGSFFATIIRDGVMPRKTFSMGEAPEKRFYIEARKIVL